MDFAILTDKKTKSNKINVVVKDYKRRTCQFTDMSVLTDNKEYITDSKKEYDKINKYKDFKIEIDKMWQYKN